MIKHSSPTIGKEEIRAVRETLLSGNLAQGEKVAKFERKFAQYLGVKDAVAVSSGTSALHLALLALGIGKDDEVIIPDYVCTALLNAVYYVQAKPVLVDIEPDNYQITLSGIKKKLSKKTKAIILVHPFGFPVEIKPILSLDIPVIEDCAQSLGARIKDEKVGRKGIISIFSFYATKLITTGEGGMVASNSLKLLKVIRDLREYDRKEKYILRYNYKMTDLAAVLGNTQLEKLDRFIERRKKIASFYNEQLKGLQVELPKTIDGREHIFFRYILRTKKNNLNRILKKFRENKICVEKPVFRPLHYYLKIKDSVFRESATAWRECFSLPIYPSLKEKEIDYIIKVSKKILS